MLDLIDLIRTPSRQRLRAKLGLALAAASLTGCATIGLAEPVHHDTPMAKFREEVVTTKGGLHVEVTQDGPSLTIDARRRCDVYERQQVRRKTTTERINEQPAKDWALAAGGAVLLGAGAGVAIDAQTSVFSDEENSRTFNEVGSTNATLFGVGAATVGAALMTLAVVDVVRASGSETKTDDVVLGGTLLGSGLACEKAPVPDEPLEVRVTRTLGPGKSGEPSVVQPTFPLGKTDADGRLTVDLLAALAKLDPTFVEHRAVLLLGGKEAGHVDVEPVVAAKEDVAWRALNVTACERPTTSDACLPLTEFLTKYPNGTHRAEASRVLAATQGRVDELRDDELWNGGGSVACTSAPKLNDADAVDAACRGVTKYRAVLPEGRRRAEADDLLKKASDRSTVLRDLAVRRATSEAARAEAEYARDAAREAAKKRTICEGECRLMCSSRRYNFGACLSGCIAASCTE